MTVHIGYVMLVKVLLMKVHVGEDGGDDRTCWWRWW